MWSRRFVTAILAGGLLGALGCRLGGIPAQVDGLYVFDASSSNVNAYGSVLLSLDGTAERRLTYNLPGGPVLYVYQGTYRLGEKGAVDLRLNEGSHVWTPRTTLVGRVLTIRSGHPADGPDNVEVYRRQ